MQRRLPTSINVRPPVAWLVGPFVVIALALAFAGWLTIFRVPATVTWLDIGSPGDERYVSGTFTPEQHQIDSFRWTTPDALINVPVPSDGTYRLTISIADIANDSRVVRITCPNAEANVQLGTGTTRQIDLKCNSTGEIPIHIEVPAFHPPNDGRPLGVALLDIRALSLDRDLTSFWRVRIGLAVASIIVGTWLAMAAVSSRRLAFIAASGVAIVGLALTTLMPEALLPINAGPAPFVALAAGQAARLLAAGRRFPPFVIGLVALATCFILPSAELSIVYPAHWSAYDADALRLFPLLTALVILAATLVGGRRATFTTELAALVAAGTTILPVIARPIVGHWSLVLDGPDWTDPASMLGAALLATTALFVLLVIYAGNTSTRWGLLTTVIVVALALSILVPWRNAVMRLNGDEPHYYVIAHSLAFDADLELLDDYLEPSYANATISPFGNIAVERATHPDRYAASTATDGDSQTIIPDTLAVVDQIVVDAAGNLDALPQLLSSHSLAIPIAGPCAISDIELEPMDDEADHALVTLRDTNGNELWRATTEASSRNPDITPPLDATHCNEDFVGSLTFESDSAWIAQAIDTASGLRILPAQPAATQWLLGPLPRDRYATLEPTANLTLYNPGTDSTDAVVTIMTDTDQLLRTIAVNIQAGATVSVGLDLQAAAAVTIDASSPIVASGTGWLPGGSYALQSMTTVSDWQFSVPAAEDRDAGVWLTLANTNTDAQVVAVIDGRDTQSVTICGHCASMLHLASQSRTRSVTIAASDGDIAVAMTTYTERTASRHFDPALPALAALPVRLAGPGGAPIISAIATILLAAGIYLLLWRLGLNEPQAVWFSCAVVLLAPLSPYSVRLYTEPLAACLIVWSLVAWDRGRHQRRYLIATLAFAGTLPLIHGRYTPLALALVAIAISTTVAAHRPPRRMVISVIVIFTALLGVIALSPLATSLRERAIVGYFAPDWALHSVAGLLLDRGSGLIPFAPWCLLAFAVRRPLHPIQSTALLLACVQFSVVALRAGGWQTFGPPARYLLPVVPLIVLLSAPAAVRLWRSPVGRAAVLLCFGWSIIATGMLHWLPLSGYIYEGHYFVDDVRARLPILAPFGVFPIITPASSSNLIGGLMLVLIVLPLALIVWRTRHALIRDLSFRHS